MTTDVSTEGFAGKASAGIVWMTAQRWFSRGFGLLTVVILTRLLSPTDFGLVAVALSIVPFVYLLADLGFSTYLVQAEAPSRRSFSTAFWYSTSIGVVLAAALWLVGPLLEGLLHAPGVAPVVAGLAPAVVCVALGAVPTAILRRQLRFRALAVQGVIAGLVGQVLAIVLAFMGFGVWALVVQTVVTQLVASTMAWISARWRPGLHFSVGEFVAMVKFGSSIVVVELVAMTRLWAENAIVAATLGLAGLGYLSIAQRLIQVGQDLTASAITPVSTVVFAQIRDHRPRLAGAYGRAQAAIYAIVIPVMVFIVVGGPQLVPLVFGSQWHASVAPAQALAVAGILTVGASLDNGLFYGLGRPNTWLVYAIGIDGLTVAVTFFVARYGLLAVGVGFVCVALFATFVRWPLVAHQLGQRWIHLARPFGQAMIVAVVLAIVGYVVQLFAGGLPGLLVLVLVGIAVSIVWLGAVRLIMPSTARELESLAGKAWRKARRRGAADATAQEGD